MQTSGPSSVTDLQSELGKQQSGLSHFLHYEGRVTPNHSLPNWETESFFRPLQHSSSSLESLFPTSQHQLKALIALHVGHNRDPKWGPCLFLLSFNLACVPEPS